MKMMYWVLSAHEREATADKGDDGPETRQTDQRSYEEHVRGNRCNSNPGTVVNTYNLSTTEAEA